MTPRPSVEAERRKQILQAAMTCFARDGYHMTTMDDIAANLPFSKGLLYYYFGTKRELFMAIMDDWMVDTMAAWDSLLAAEADSPTLIRTFIQFGVQLVAQSAELSRVEFEFIGELGRNPSISEAFKSLYTRLRSQIKAIIEAGIARGEIRQLDTDAVSAVVLGIFEGLALQAVVDHEAFDWPVVADTLWQVVMHGITSA